MRIAFPSIKYVKKIFINPVTAPIVDEAIYDFNDLK